MARAAEEHVRLAQRVLGSMDEFGDARRQEASSAGASVAPDPAELTAGLLCGFSRAHRRVGAFDSHLVPKALRYLGRTRPEYARASDLLAAPNRSDVTSAWSDFAEAIVDATAGAQDPSDILLQFAALAREHDVAYEAADIDLEQEFEASPDYLHAKPATLEYPLRMS